MSAAQSIWASFKKGNITTKQALDTVGSLLVSASDRETTELLNLASKILDHDVPLLERNVELEESFWNSTHRNDE